MIKSRLTRDNFIAVRNEYTQLNLTPVELLVYSIVASYTDDSKACFETNKTISERICASVSTVQRAFKSLENKGYIYKEEQEDYISKRLYFAKPVEQIIAEQGIEPKEFRTDKNDITAIEVEIEDARDNLEYKGII